MKFFTVVTLFLVSFSSFASFDVKEFKTSSDQTIWFAETPSVPDVVSVSIGLKNRGFFFDPNGKIGLADISTHLMGRGAGPYTFGEMQKEFGKYGISYRESVGSDQITFSIKFVKSYSMNKAIELLNLILSSPRFEQAHLDDIKRKTLVGIQRAKANEKKARVAFANLLYYGPNHPLSQIESKASIESITLKDIKAWHRQNVTKQNLLVGIAGDLSQEEAETLFEGIVKGLPSGGVIQQKPAFLGPKGKGLRALVRMPTVESSLIFKHSLDFIPSPMTSANPAFTARVLNERAGGGTFSSMLGEEVRVKRGLVYGISSYVNTDSYHSKAWVQTSTPNANVAEVMDIVEDQWGQAGQGVIQGPDLKDYVSSIVGSFPLIFQSTSKIASQMAYIQSLDWDVDYYNTRNDPFLGIDLADQARLDEVAKKTFRPEDFLIVVAGDPAEDVQFDLEFTHDQFIHWLDTGVAPTFTIPAR